LFVLDLFRISPLGGAACCLVLIALAVGCAPDTSQGRKFERLGQYPQAYESYCKALSSDSGDSAAAAGLKRTVPRAVEYWQRQAVEAAQAGQWQRAAQCHLKVLQIQPNENNSLLALRDIARLHEQEVELAKANQVASAGGRVEDQLEIASAGRRERPAPQPELAMRRPVSPPVPVAAPPALKVDAYRQRPVSRSDEPASAGEFLQVGRMSKKDRRYHDIATFYGGVSLKLRGTDDEPDRADVEVYYGSKKLSRFKNVVPNSIITAVSPSGQRYDLVVLDVVNQTETLTVGLRMAR